MPNIYSWKQSLQSIFWTRGVTISTHSAFKRGSVTITLKISFTFPVIVKKLVQGESSTNCNRCCEGYVKALLQRLRLQLMRWPAPSTLRQSHSRKGWLGTSHSPALLPSWLKTEHQTHTPLTKQRLMASMFFFLQTFEFYWEIFESGPSEHRPASSSSAYLYTVQPNRRKQRGTYEWHAPLLVCEPVIFFSCCV